MARNLIVCCDGTGNEIKENQSNVLKFYRLLKKNEDQVGFYDPGVGTISDSSSWDRFKNKASGVFGLATGYGLDGNVLEAYRFLIRNYREGDSIYLFGFSRGAYTVRVLAGFINMVGLLNPSNENLSGYALTAYKQASERDDLAIAWRFPKVLDTRTVTIRFMGCWDTVGSVIVPRPDRGYIPSFEKLPYTRRNSCVQVFRHAMAIDERRRMFRLLSWEEDQKFKTNPFMPEEKAERQNCKQVWFAGVHADIGGGYPETESGPAQIPLRWMVGEAEQHGLVFRPKLLAELVDGESAKGMPATYNDLHDSMKGAWKILEWLPKKAKFKEWKKRKTFLGFYLPRSEPRPIQETPLIDPSVYERTYYSGEKEYRPVNLPAHKHEG